MTEASVPFTCFQIEDAIFVDQHHILALEFAKFHKDEAAEQKDRSEPNYQKLEVRDTDGAWNKMANLANPLFIK